LFKDVGGIPYALAKYCKWNSVFAYGDFNGRIENAEYEKYVNLLPIHIASRNKYMRRWEISKFLWENIKSFDVLNMYHCSEWALIYCWIAKMRNPNVKTYIKLDMGRQGFKSRKKRRWWNILTKYVNVFTVETKNYLDDLKKMEKFKGKVKYLPNGFFSDLANLDDSEYNKENIILTVGRPGTYEKNTEMLLDVFAKLCNTKP